MDDVNKEDIPDLLIKSGSNGLINNSILDSSTGSTPDDLSNDKLRHLSKSRPRRHKTRAPSKAAIVSSSVTQTHNESTCDLEKFDYGLESFFCKTVTMEPAKTNSTPKNSIFKNIGFHFVGSEKSRLTPKLSPNDEMSSSMFAESSTPTNSFLIASKIEEVTRSHSSPNLNHKKQLTPQSSSVASGAGNGVVGGITTTNTILAAAAPPTTTTTTTTTFTTSTTFTTTTTTTTSSSPRTVSPSVVDEINTTNQVVVGRMASPVPSDPTSDILAEMKAKGGKLSLTHTPVSSALSTPEETTGTNSSQMSQSLPSSNFSKIRLRASAFGEVLKSQSKNSLSGDDIISDNTKSVANNSSTKPPNVSQTGTAISTSTTTTTNQPKQRPKSIVGMLGAKFELGALDTTTDLGSSDNNEISHSTSDVSKERSMSSEEGKIRMKKTMAMFGRNSFMSKGGSPSSDSETRSLPSKSKIFASSSFLASSNLSSLNSKSSSNV